MDLTAPEKKYSQHNPQHGGWPIRRSVPSFSPKPSNEAVGLGQASVNNMLLGLLGPYHQHGIGMFKTCSRSLTHRSLTNTGGGYSLEDADFLHTTLRPSQPTVLPFPPAFRIPLPDLPNWRSSPFHLRALPGLQFIQNLSTKLKFEFKGTYGRHVVFRPLDHLP
jgi:hypothetical protein